MIVLRVLNTCDTSKVIQFTDKFAVVETAKSAAITVKINIAI
jgi:hypothetical protein